MASPAYSREYREWIQNGVFNQIYSHGLEYVQDGIRSERPDLVLEGLQRFALCYYTRGAVALLEGSQQGWNEVQCGYLATIYSIRFLIPLKSGLAASHKESADDLVSAVMTLGLARLFAVSFDEKTLRDWLEPRFDPKKLTGKVSSGRHILNSIFEKSHSIGVEELRRDRKECCQKRDAWPKRPTEIGAFGILDIEMAINFPN